jgi:EpsD family peptidyl-prolyl cis-trans isomerase
MSGNAWIRRLGALASVGLACVALVACGEGKTKAPSGQVVATVDGEEITLRELRAEMGALTIADPNQRRQAEQQALQAIVQRKVLAKAAQEQKLDKSPDYALLKQRALELSLVQSLQDSLIKRVPASTQEEAEEFIAAHPDSFAERKIFIVDQIRTPQPGDPALVEKIKPLNTLDEVAALFTREQVPFQRVNDHIDARTADPAVIEQVLKLRAGEVFGYQSGPLLILNTIKETRVEPFTGEAAVKSAMERLRQKHIQEAAAIEVNRILEAAKSKIVYNKQFQPAPPAKPAVPAPTPTKATADGNVGV